MKLANRFLILNAPSLAEARAAWRTRFENRSVADRKPVKMEIRAAAADTTEILLYDEIGFWGITAKEFAGQLSGITTPAITLRINSPGGDVFDGFAIYNALLAHPAKITTVVEGLAASAASFIALAGETVMMAETAFMMVHKAWGIGIGNADDMRSLADTLDKIDGQIADIYAKKTAQDRAAMLALMTGESDGTWFTSAEAKDLGLIDQIVGAAEQQDAAENATGLRIRNMRRRLALAAHED